MNLNLEMTEETPTNPGTYLVFFPNTLTYDVVSLILVPSAHGELAGSVLVCPNRGGSIRLWQCLWSEPLPYT